MKTNLFSERLEFPVKENEKESVSTKKFTRIGKAKKK